MKKILFLIVVLLAGIGTGGGAAYATVQLFGLGARPAAQAAAPAPEKTVPTQFVPTGKILAPLVFGDGRLAGYVSFEVQIEVEEGQADFIKARLPLLLHAINMRTYRTPMAAGPDGMLPNLETFRKVVMAAAAEAFGPKVVRKAAVTSATPA